MQIVRTILQLLQRKTSERSITKELNISRNTVRKYAVAAKASPYACQELLAMDDPTLREIIYPSQEAPEEPDDDPRLSAFEARRAYFLKELTRTGVTKQILWEEYRQDNPGAMDIPSSANAYAGGKKPAMYPCVSNTNPPIRS